MSDDPLNISSSPKIRIHRKCSISAPAAVPNVRRSERHKARLSSVATVTVGRQSQRTAKRDHSAMSDNTDDLETPSKKLKIILRLNPALQKASEQRTQRDISRNIWLLRYRKLFEPLLPSHSRFFDTLEEQVKQNKTDHKYQPLHQLDQQPALIQGGELKDYQLQGLSFLVWMFRNGVNCILGDEMGLGKTLQTLSLLAYCKENSQDSLSPHLVICPLSVLASWENEAARWLPSFKTLRFYGTREERERLKLSFRNVEFDLMLTTYESFVADEGWFKSRRWTYCILDEGHKIKNSDTNVSSKVSGIGSLYRLILTGTPVQNNLSELWSLLHWLFPLLFTDATERVFRDAFDLTKGSYSVPFINAAQELLSTIMIRRTKANVEFDVPPREELTVFIPMSEAQRFWVYRLLARMDTDELKTIFSDVAKDQDNSTFDLGRREVLSQLENQMRAEQEPRSGKAGQHYKKLMNLLLQLRRVCDHPYLLTDAEPEPYNIGEHLVAASSKLVVIDKLLASLLPKGERVLIFSQWTHMLDVLEDFMHLRRIPYARLDGQTRRPRRTLDIRLFQQEESPYKVFLISTRAGGLGINLTKATTVIMTDSDWNPQNDLQAIARAHRIGQKQVVKVYRLICKGSVEDQMLDRLRRKLFLSIKLTDSETGGGSSESTSMGMRDLMDILRKGSSALSSGMDFGRFLEAPIEDILNQSKGTESARDAKLQNDLDPAQATAPQKQLVADAETEEQSLLCGVAQVQSRLFEGKIVQSKYTKNREIADDWRNLQKRARVDRTVSVGGMKFIVDPLMDWDPLPSSATPKPEKRTRAKFEWDDYCLHCRDGGDDLFCCSYCPRVFHATCNGYTLRQAQAVPSIRCSQHQCCECERGTQESGGMLFRCRTCPNAFCEDCLPEKDIDYVGDIIPEFLLLDYPAKDNAYFIGCHDCKARSRGEPIWWSDWQTELDAAAKRVAALDKIP